MSQLTEKEMDRLAGELASFARSGVPLPEGLAQLEASLPSGKLKNLAAHAATGTEQGRPLSDTLESGRVRVPASFAALVRCGEISGDMGGVLDYTLKHGRRLKQHRSSMATILIYPLLVLLVLIMIMLFAAVFVVPRFKDIYDQLGAELPGPTELLVQMSNFFAGAGFLLVIALVIVSVYLLVAAVTERLPARVMELLPGMRNLLYLSDTAVMTEFVGHLLSRGVPLPEACRAASLVVYRPDMRQSLENMAAVAEQGGNSSEKMNSHVPATAAWLYRQGEVRGTLSESCAAIAGYCERRFDLLSRRTLYMMEPMFVLIIAIACGFALISLYLPLFNIPKIVGR